METLKTPEYKQTHKSEESVSIGAVLRELGISTKDLIQSEIDLIKTEIKESARTLGKTAAKTAISGGLLVMSVLPFLAFLVIGLGELLDGRYWLSSLIVSLVSGITGGVLLSKSYKEMKGEDFSLPRSRETLKEEQGILTEKMEEFKNVTKGRVA